MQISSTADAQGGLLGRGLARFARLWALQEGRLVSARLEGALGRSIRCESTDGEVVDFCLLREKLEFEEHGSRRTPHASIRMAPRDWARVFGGELHVMAIILAGRAPFPKDQRRLLMQFSMLLQTTMLAGGGGDE
ncbi:MAG: hypothetical protein J0H00_12395 [Burkholderiales bacterium]|nr:hypothetical protein [Burkholderiales bacterium]OJX05325.1 MAG: hypothetical protein BGO72_13960 [Burkholderiales bacterium 70-64]